MAAGIRFFISMNGVILSEGNDQGFIPKELFLQVVDYKTNTPLPGYGQSDQVADLVPKQAEISDL